jgi:hypothetical protein
MSVLSLPHPCDYCGKISPSNLRCSKCQSVWYCDRSCQSSAWDHPSTTKTSVGCGDDDRGKGERCGHREICRQLRRKNKKKQSTLVELMQHVQTLDCNEAYRRMCLAQDEIQRLKSSTLLGETIPQHHNNEQQLNQLQRHYEPNPTDRTIQNKNDREIANANSESKSPIATTDRESEKVRIITPNPDDDAHAPDKLPPPPVHSSYRRKVSGVWLGLGGKISIEYLPNVKCYNVMLHRSTPTNSTTDEGIDDPGNWIPKSQNELYCTMTPRVMTNDDVHDNFEVKLYQCENDTIEGHIVLLSTILPTPPLWRMSHKKEGSDDAVLSNVNISLDENSISLRIHLVQNRHQATTPMTTTESENLVDILLLGTDTSTSSFSPHAITSAFDLNYLRCRSCHHPLLLRDISITEKNDNTSSSCHSDIRHPSDITKNTTTSIIQSVLPLPSGYWDDISDYLMCYDGQASVDFTSSSTCAIARTALEDDAILVLHRSDLDVVAGVCALDALGGGYGEHSTMEGYRKHYMANGAGSDNEGGESGAAFRVWKDRAAIHGMKAKTATCATCYSTLGYVSEHDNDTFRLYKHLLDCGKKLNVDDGNAYNDCGGRQLAAAAAAAAAGGGAFSKYSIASFLARELVRYAESDAVYTFIVGISDVNDWTRMGRSNPGKCILLRTLGWDTPMSTVEGGTMSDDNEDGDDVFPDYPLCFQKVVKVIFEEVKDSNVLTASQQSNGDDPIEWTWGGTDFCCPPPLMQNDMIVQNRVSSVGMFLSEREWCELKDALHRSSDYFPKAVNDAIVMTKLGLMPPNTSDRQQMARLSFLPLITY